MLKKIVVASDSFKGSLSSTEVAAAVVRAAAKTIPGCEVVTVPVADGGEGTVEALAVLPGFYVAECSVHDPLMRKVKARYAVAGDGRTAVIESAAACGLTLLSPEERNPSKTTTYGVGQIIGDAIGRGSRRFVIGIGGSATNDGGTGMLRALGFRFLDKGGNEVEDVGSALREICRIDNSGVLPEVAECEFNIACDVDNPFTGPTGAAAVFAPQKGADSDMVTMLDAGMRNLARVIYDKTGTDLDKVPGSGAAGGLGGAFHALLGGRLSPGIDTILDAVGFDGKIENADLVITGEGRMDSQTLCGKAPMGVLMRAKRKGIPVIGICGSVDDATALTESGFTAIFPIIPGVVDLDVAMDKTNAAANVERTAGNILRLVNTFGK